jgi:hypothetical protein
MTAAEETKNKKEQRVIRAHVQKEARAERSDLEQLILISTDPNRGSSMREKLRLMQRIRDRYRNDPQGLEGARMALKEAGLKIKL